MEESVDEELIAHTVNVDKYTELTLKIPKVMTALDLKSLTLKANKIFNLSEVPLVSRKQSSSSNGDTKFYFTDALDGKLYKLRETNKKPWKQIAEEFGISVKRCEKRMYNLKGKGRWSEKLLEALQ